MGMITTVARQEPDGPGLQVTDRPHFPSDGEWLPALWLDDDLLHTSAREVAFEHVKGGRQVLHQV